MTSGRRFLIAILIALLIAGGMVATMPFFASLGPSQRAQASVASFPEDAVGIGETRIFPAATEAFQVFVSRVSEFEYFIFGINYDVRLKRYWTAPSYEVCERLLVEIPKGRVGCVRDGSAQFWWDFEGRSGKSYISDLLVFDYARKAGHVRYGRGL